MIMVNKMSLFLFIWAKFVVVMATKWEQFIVYKSRALNNPEHTHARFATLGTKLYQYGEYPHHFSLVGGKMWLLWQWEG